MDILRRWFTRSQQEEEFDYNDPGKVAIHRKYMRGSYGRSITNLPISQSPTECLFFSRLSFELRQTILIAAFGDRTVFLTTALRRAETPTKTCTQYIQREGWEYPGQDGTRRWCYPQSSTGKQRIQATNFLRTCRQAHKEGIDILYKTNTFRIESVTLAKHLDTFVTRSRLAMVRKIQFVLNFTHERLPLLVEGGTEPYEGEDFRSLMSHLPKSLPNVREFRFAIEDNVKRDWDGVSWHMTATWFEGSVLYIMPNAIKQWAYLQVCELAVPMSLYVPWRKMVTRQEWNDWKRGKGGNDKIWVDVDVKLVARGTNPVFGYWVVPSVNDLPREEQIRRE